MRTATRAMENENAKLNKKMNGKNIKENWACAHCYPDPSSQHHSSLSCDTKLAYSNTGGSAL